LIVQGLNGICDSDSDSDVIEQREIRDVIAYVRTLADRNAKPCNNLVQRSDLVTATLNKVRHAQFGHPPFHSPGLSAADYCDLDAGIKKLAYAVSILGIESLGLDAFIR
jgi:hypothetical protein